MAAWQVRPPRSVTMAEATFMTGSQSGLVIATSKADRERLCIGDDDVLKLAGQAIAIEEHYSRAAGVPTPMDIEWAKDGPAGEIYIVQARPETVASRRSPAARPVANTRPSVLSA
jgi:phosphoenolpyruvate synthase/pyruvate phosphate dikinase